MCELAKVQFVSPNWSKAELLKNLPPLLDAGLKCFQLRLKDKPDAEIVDTAIAARELCLEYNCLFILNDYYHLFEDCKAHAIHLGKSDTDILTAKKELAKTAIIGATCNTLQDVLDNHKLGVNYVGLGPFRFTTTKKNLSPILGLEGYRQIIASLKKQKVSLPIYAIGGITTSDFKDLKNVGVNYIAASGLFVGNDGIKNLKLAIDTFG